MMMRAIVREARPKQWTKNVLVFAAPGAAGVLDNLSLIHISEPTRLLSISYAVFCLKKKKHNNKIHEENHCQLK